MNKIRVGSLFSGIGGLELGLGWALGDRAHTVWQVECEEWPRKVLAKHWPNADRSVTDVREGNSQTLSPVDLICGGFPCQDISVAGNQEGFDGKKSSLWFEMARIIREIRPQFIVLENVPAITSIHSGTVHGRVLKDLAEAGYHVEWCRLGANDVGAPHRRWRWFCIGWLANADYSTYPTVRREHEAIPEEGTSGGTVRGGGSSDAEREESLHGSREVEGTHMADTRSTRRDGSEAITSRVPTQVTLPTSSSTDVADTMCERLSGQGQHEYTSSDTSASKGQASDAIYGRKANPWSSERAVGRVVDGFPTKLDRLNNREALKALGNAVVPQCSYRIGVRLLEIEKHLAEVSNGLCK